MIKINTYIIILIFLIISGVDSFAQKLESKGTIHNNGTIKVKGVMKSEGGNAHINNQGVMIIEGNAFVDQDTLDGRVEYTGTDNTPYQIIPQLSYRTVIFSGSTNKKFENQFGRSFRSLDTFYTASEAVLQVDQNEIIFINGRITHGGLINPAKNYGKVRLEGLFEQDIDGGGIFKILELDNTEGAEVINSGGFQIDRQLELTRGAFRNSLANNFIMGSGSWIIRTTEGSLAEEPEYIDNYSVRYVGDGSILAGGEIPADNNVLYDLEVFNTLGLTLSKNTYIDNLLTLNSSIFTEPDASEKYELVINSTLNPAFGNYDSEIDGTVRRTRLTPGDTMIFNNPFTYIYFEDPASLNGAREFAVRSKPQTSPPYTNSDLKVVRFFTLSAKGESSNNIDSGMNAVFGYGWRNSSDPAKTETNGLRLPDLLLQRWTGSEWIDITTSEIPTADSTKEWAYSFATAVKSMGDFAIGLSVGAKLTFEAKVLLEGPYRYGSMATDLLQSGRIPTTPPDIYPYNLDKQRQFIALSSVPDSVVDWIVLEFKADLQGEESFYKTCFLKSDGSIVDLDGYSPIVMSGNSMGIDTGGGDFYMAIRHRNHLTVVTKDAIGVYPDSQEYEFDFTNPDLVLGGSQAVKAVDFDLNDKPKFVMIGGSFGENESGRDIIDLFDYRSTWDNINIEGYLYLDYDMNGIITTRDYNMSWNNRMRTGFFK